MKPIRSPTLTLSPQAIAAIKKANTAFIRAIEQLATLAKKMTFPRLAVPYQDWSRITPPNGWAVRSSLNSHSSNPVCSHTVNSDNITALNTDDRQWIGILNEQIIGKKPNQKR